jgi:O-antigen/teichoic acid export membrane protein
MSNHPNNNLKELSLQSLYGLLGNGFIQLFTFLASIIYTNLLGADKFGVYTGLISFFTLISSIVLFAFDRSLILHLTRNWASKELGKFKGNALTSLAVMAGLFILVGLVFMIFRKSFLANYLGGQISNLYLVYGFTFMFFTVLVTWHDTVINSMKSIGLITLSKVVRKLSALGFFLIGFYVLDAGLDSLFVGQVIGLIFGIGFYFFRRRRTFSTIASSDTDHSERREMLSYTTTLFLVGLSTAISKEIDKVLMSYYVNDTAQLAYYAVAIRTSTMVSLVGASVAMIFRPRVAEKFGKQDFSGMSDDYRITTQWILFLSAPALMTLFIMPSETLSVFGKEFMEAGLILRLVVIGVFVEMIFGLNTVIMVLSGKNRLIITVSLAAVAANVAVNLILIPHYGAYGAAIATIITYVVGRTLSLIFVYREFGILPYSYRTLFRMLIPMAGLALLTWGMESLMQGSFHPLLMVVISFIINYIIAILYYLNFLANSDELLLISELKSSLSQQFRQIRMRRQ